MRDEPQTRVTYAVSPGVSRAITRLARRQARMSYERWMALLRLLASVPGSESEHLGITSIQNLELADWQAMGALLVVARDGEDVAAALAALTVGAGERADCTEREVRIVELEAP